MLAQTTQITVFTYFSSIKQMEIPIPSLFISDDDDDNLIPSDPNTSNSNPDDSNAIINSIIIANPSQTYPGSFHIIYPFITIIIQSPLQSNVHYNPISINPIHYNPISIISFFDNDNDYHHQSISIHYNHFLLITCIFIFVYFFFLYLF